MNRNKFLNNSGFSLIEILVSIGILGALSLGAMWLMESAGKSSKAITVAEEINQHQREMINILSVPNNCGVSLTGIGIDPNFVSNAGVTGNVSAISVFDPNNPNVAIDKYVVENPVPHKLTLIGLSVSTVAPNGASDWSSATATLVATYNKPSSAAGGQQIKREIKISANLCDKNVIMEAVTANHSADIQKLLAQCTGDNLTLLQGATNWDNANWYAICQDCTGVSGSSPINYCHAVGGESERTNVQSMAETTCAYMGGAYDSGSSQCEFDGQLLIDKVCAIEEKAMREVGKTGTTSCGVIVP